MIGADPAYLAFISRSRSPDSLGSANTTDTLGGHPRSKTAIQSILVVCDGTQEGDNATHLAAAIARNTAATVRAVTWLTPSVARSAANMDRAPIEDMLDRVTQQLYRCTRNPGFWRLLLLTGDFAPAVARVARSEQVDLLIMPSGMSGGTGLQNRVVLATSIPVARVTGHMGDADYHVCIATVAHSASQRLARLAASVIAVIFRSEAGASPSTVAPVEVRTVSPLHVTPATGMDEGDFSRVS